MTKDGTALAIDSAHLISSLFALIPIPVAVADERGCVVLANSCFGETFQGITNISTLPHHEVEVPGRTEVLGAEDALEIRASGRADVHQRDQLADLADQAVERSATDLGERPKGR